MGPHVETPFQQKPPWKNQKISKKVATTLCCYIRSVKQLQLFIVIVRSEKKEKWNCKNK